MTLRLTVNPSTMTPSPPQVDGDPYDSYSDAAPPPKQEAIDPYEAYSDDKPPPKKLPGRKIGRLESAGTGLAEGLSFGFNPAFQGAIAAGTPEGNGAAVEPEPGAIELLHGLARLGFESLTGPGKATEAYRKRRDEVLDQQNQASEQNPYSYMGGQIAGALATPMGSAKTIGRAALQGAAAGGLSGAGTAISEGQGPIDVGMSAAENAATGGAFGAAGSAVVKGVGKVLQRIGSIGRGAFNPEAEAARGIRNTLAEDFHATGDLGMDQEAAAAGRKSGMPVSIIDAGGQATRDLARAAGNVSPQAWGDLERFTSERAEGRQSRISAGIHALFGGKLDSASGEHAAIQQAAKRANRPAYARAYAAGDRPIWSPELERLASSPAVEDAIRGAVERGKDRAVAGGFGGFNPSVKVTPDGRVQFPRGPKGVPTYPNIQFWDYVQRELSDAAKAADRQGRNEQAGALKGILSDLKDELDRQVPEFAAARAGAAQFFKADEAGEAGRNFVMMNSDPRDARRAIGKMTPPERELFARGFADELAQTVMRTANTMATIKRIFTSPLAKEKIEIAIGPARARELEALLRAETIAQRAKDALGNSTTARQQALIEAFKSGGHGVAGAGAIGAFELAKDGDFDPKSLIGTALIVGAARHGAHKVDTRVAREIGRMLVSNDPAVLKKGATIVAKSPALFEALRAGTGRATAAAMRTAAHDVGPAGVGAGAMAALQYVLQEEDEHHHAHDTDQQPQQ